MSRFNIVMVYLVVFNGVGRFALNVQLQSAPC